MIENISLSLRGSQAGHQNTDSKYSQFHTFICIKIDLDRFKIFLIVLLRFNPALKQELFLVFVLNLRNFNLRSEF